ncbi:hypothetical protein, partial [Salmonella sp. s54836]|uniref:hypothetical protein n=1 Tax=Salmonella sp. s54836 TaxID=3159673 RepID=UPI00397EDF19
SDTTADQYTILQVTIQTNGSAYAIKHSDTNYTLLQSYSTVTVTSDTLLACATDSTTDVPNSINWYYVSIDNNNGEMNIPATDTRVSVSTTTGISTLSVTDSTADRGIYICRVTVNSGSTDEYRVYFITSGSAFA